MSDEALKVSLLCGTGAPNPSIPELLKTCAQVQLWGQASELEDLLLQHRGIAPDLVIVDLDGQNTPPGWLPELTRRLPHSAVMVCSQNKDPDFIIQVMRQGVREFSSAPLEQSELEATLERVRVTRKEPVIPETGMGQLVVVTGLKGGVGVTSIAVNLAVCLAEIAPHRVVVADLGRPFPDVAKFLYQDAKANFMDLVENKDHLDLPLVTKILQPNEANFAVLQGCPGFRDLDSMDPRVLTKTWEILRRMFDWIIVDLGPCLNDIYIKTVQAADIVLLLTELMIPDLQNLKSLWGLYQEYGIDREKMRVVVNRYSKSGGVELRDMERILQKPPFFTLPSDFNALSDSINQGIPLAALAPRSKLCRSLRELSLKLASTQHPDMLQAATRRSLWRLPFLS
jgi:pilus assembly protein CpaE